MRKQPKVYQSEMWQKATFTHRVGIVAEVTEAYIPEHKMSSSADIFKYIVDSGMYDIDSSLYEEKFHLIALNKGHKVIGHSLIGIGSDTSVVVSIKKIMQFSVLVNACSIVLIHNHPSCRKQPSQPDIELTRKVKEACKVHDIDLLDHIIVNGDLKDYYSFADEGAIITL